MEGNHQPPTFKHALASMFSDVFQPPSSIEAKKPPEADDGDGARFPVEQDARQEQQQDQPFASNPADPYSLRVARIQQKFDAEAAAAVGQQQQLQQAVQQAKQWEQEALAAADAAYTPAWRQAGLPAKASQLAVDATWLAGAQLINPAATMQQHTALQHKEVLQLPAVFEYCDKEADPHYFTATNNLKVRQNIGLERVAGVKTQKMQMLQLKTQQQQKLQLPAQQQQQQHSKTISRSTRQPSNLGGALPNTYVGFRAAHRSIPWSQLPQEEVSQKAAAAAARYKALSGIMTPEQRESEERMIKSMYHRLSFLRNPRYATSPAAVSLLQNKLQGSSCLRRQQQHHSPGSKNRSSGPSCKSSQARESMQTATQSGMVTPGDVGFCVLPAAGVLFDAYEPGGVYFQTLQLQNVGNVIRGLRLLPPASRFFQMSLPRFPTAANELAPGMSAEVSVCFTPDTLGDYSDAFVVETVLGNFKVSLSGRRPHPHLTLAEELHAGVVLVGNSRRRTVDFINTGGAGRFLVLSAADWAAAQVTDGNSHQQLHHQQLERQHSAVSVSSPRAAQSSLAASSPDKRAAAAAAVALEQDTAQAVSAAAASGAFAVMPTFLDLPTGSSGRLTVDFHPDGPGQHVGEFVLICDNCSVRPLKLMGRGSDVDVQLVALDGRQLEEQDKQAPVWFGQVSPGCSCSRTVQVKNSTQLPFPYKWQVNHLLLPGSAQTAVEAELRLPDRSLVGLAAGDACGANALAATAAAEQSISDKGGTSAAGSSYTSSSIEASSRIAIAQQLRASASGTYGSSSSLHSEALPAQQQQQVQELEIQAGQQLAAFAVHPSSGVLQPEESAEFTVEFKPPCEAEHAASAVLLVERSGDAILTALTASGSSWNGSNSAATGSSCTTLKAAAAATAIACQAGSPCESNAHAATDPASDPDSAAVTGGWESAVALGLEGLAVPVCLAVEPSSVVHLPGQLTVGDVGQQVLVLHNKSAAAACFSFQQKSSNIRSPTSGSNGNGEGSQADHEQAAASAVVFVEPSSGIVPSFGSVEVTVQFTGLAAGTHTEKLLCQVAHGAAVPIVAKVSVVGPVVTPPVPVIDFGIICIGSSRTQQLQLNNTAAHCRTEWQLVQLDNQVRIWPRQLLQSSCPTMKLQLLPNAGMLAPAADSSVAVTVTGNCMGSHKMLLQLTSSSSSSASQRICFVQVLVTVSEPCVVLDTYKIHLNPAYLGVQQQQSITMTNTSRLPLQFSWTVQQVQWQQQRHPDGSKQSSRSIEGSKPSRTCDSSNSGSNGSDSSAHTSHAKRQFGQLELKMLPEQGQLEPEQSIQLQLQLDPTHVGPVKLLCCCVVPNMSQLVGFVLTAFIQGLQVAYGIERPLHQGWLAGVAPAGLAQAGISNTKRLQSDSDALSAAAVAGVTSGGAEAAAAATTAVTEPLLADFGAVAVHQTSELRLRVTNLTSIDTEVSAWVSRYPAAAVAATAKVEPSSMHHTEQQTAQQQQQQLGLSLSGAQPKAGSQSDQPASLQPGLPDSSELEQLRSLPKNARRLPLSALPANPVPAQPQQQHALGQTSSSDSNSSPQPRQQTFSPQQRQQQRQQQQSSIAARLAAAVSGGCGAAATLSPRAINTSLTATPPEFNSGTFWGPQLSGPFRSAAGNSMMAARRLAAAAAGALDQGQRGCAVAIQPPHSRLAGWDSIDLQLVAYNNLPGTYTDWLCVQVGDLPVHRIPLRLSVVGSPLVISKERVLLQGLQALLALQKPTAALPAAVAAAAAVTAADDSDCSSAGRSRDSTTGPDLDNVSGLTTVQLQLGVVPVGVRHERTFYVVNTGALSMHLSWLCSVAPTATATTLAPATVVAATQSVAGCAAAASDCGSRDEQVSFLPIHRDAEAAAAGHVDRPDSSTQLTVDRSSTSTKDASTAATAAKAAASKGSAAPAAAAAAATEAKNSSKTAPSTSAGRTSTTGAAAKGQSGSGAAKATTSSAGGAIKRPSGSGAASRQQQPAQNSEAAAAAAEVQQQQQEQLQKQGQDSASEDASVTSDTQHCSSTIASAAAAESASAVPDYEQLLPIGGPSSLLKTLQAMTQHRKQQQQQQMPSLITAVAAATASQAFDSQCSRAAPAIGIDSTHLLQPFTVEPQQCVLPAGQHQKFTVAFISWHSGVHAVNLIGQQAFATAGASDNEYACTADDVSRHPALTVMLWPWQQPHVTDDKAAAGGNSSGSANAAAAAAVQPLELIVSGGFHAHAAPPLKPMPNLRVALSATAIAAQLTPNDPSSMAWTCWSTHDPSSHNSYMHTVTLGNTAGCLLIFQFAAEGPFSLVSAVPSIAQDLSSFRGLKGTSALDGMLSTNSGSSSTQRLPTDIILLPPGQSVDATVLFTPPAAATAQAFETRQQQQHGDSNFVGALVVLPTNGQRQCLPLSATVLHPALTARPDSLDFGRVHSSAPRPLDLLLTNPTTVDAVWHAEVLLQTTAAGSSSSSGVFTVMPDQGVIPGRGLGMPKTQRVSVTYAPAGNPASVGELRLLVEEGNGCSVKLQGQGTFEESCEHLAILKDM